MKKTILLSAVFLLSIVSFAQKQGPGKAWSKFSPEQHAELQSKQMSLHLDLSEKQQKEVYNLLLKNAQEREKYKEEREARRESGEKPSEEELFNIKNRKLDHQLAMQKEMKKILDDKQFEKYLEWQKERKRKMNNRPRKMNNKGKGFKPGAPNRPDMPPMPDNPDQPK